MKQGRGIDRELWSKIEDSGEKYASIGREHEREVDVGEIHAEILAWDMSDEEGLPEGLKRAICRAAAEITGLTARNARMMAGEFGRNLLWSSGASALNCFGELARPNPVGRDGGGMNAKAILSPETLRSSLFAGDDVSEPCLFCGWPRSHSPYCAGVAYADAWASALESLGAAEEEAKQSRQDVAFWRRWAVFLEPRLDILAKEQHIRPEDVRAVQALVG